MIGWLSSSAMLRPSGVCVGTCEHVSEWAGLVQSLCVRCELWRVCGFSRSPVTQTGLRCFTMSQTVCNGEPSVPLQLRQNHQNLPAEHTHTYTKVNTRWQHCLQFLYPGLRSMSFVPSLHSSCISTCLCPCCSSRVYSCPSQFRPHCSPRPSHLFLSLSFTSLCPCLSPNQQPCLCPHRCFYPVHIFCPCLARSFFFCLSLC